MNPRDYPIPGTLNVVLGCAIMAICTSLLWASGQVHAWWSLGLVIAGYALAMNTGYALIHEAEHDIFHTNRRLNDVFGALITLFFPSSFHLRRIGHVGHHLRNRTDDEAFDLYFDEDNPMWKRVQFYGILIGLFWLVIVLSNIPAAIRPAWLAKGRLSFERTATALQDTINPKYYGLIQWESCAVFLLHGGLILGFHLPFLPYFATLTGFGVLWSTLQYVHHFETERDVVRGAKNLRVSLPVDKVWLHHHWHLTHHLHPTVPWIHLPKLDPSRREPRIPFWTAYWQMWRGPRLTHERLANRVAGKWVS